MIFREIWNRLTPGRLTAAALGPGGAVLGDDRGLVTVVTVSGRVLSELPLPAPILDLDARSDEHVGVLAGGGEIVLLEAGKVVFRRPPDARLSRILVGPHADYLLALGRSGEGIYLNRFGREIATFSAPEQILGAAVVDRTGQVVTVAADGTVRGYTAWGKAQWQAPAGPTPGAPATDERGSLVLVPMMAYGVEAFTAAGARSGAYDVGEPVRHAACSGDGERILLATSDDRLVLLRRDGSVAGSERFPSAIAKIGLSSDGRFALVTTASGYAHLLGLSFPGEERPIEMETPPPAARTPWRMKKRVFSPHSLVVKSRVAFAPDSSFLAVAGDRRRVEVFDLDGRELGLRRYGGSLLELEATANDEVRVYATRSVFRFRPGEDGSVPEWVGDGDLGHLARRPDGSALGLTENGEVLRFPAGGGRAERLFSLAVLDAASFAAVGDAIAVTTKRGLFTVFDIAGKPLGSTGPFPAAPRILAVSELGCLYAVGKLLALAAPDGTEKFRVYVESPIERAAAVPGAFLAVDAAGDAYSVTGAGLLRKAFRAGTGAITPFPDAGDGPGFVVLDGPLFSAVAPDGTPRLRFRAPADFQCAAASPDGRFAAGVAGTDLFVFPLAVGDPGEPATAAEYLEFADG